ncbi:MAG: hypothetical protein HY526_01510 [Betaproteobacteria bacterium]|nr:hypothetical protein [Betaproteobacteria bacterium]
MIRKRAAGGIILLAALTFSTMFSLPVAAQGYPARAVRVIVPFPPGAGVDIVTRIVAPGATPKSVVTRLHAEIVNTLRQPEVQERLASQGATAIGNTPEQFAAYIRSETGKWTKVLKTAGVRAD